MATALLLIDLQRDFCSPGGYAHRAGIDITRTQAVVVHELFLSLHNTNFVVLLAFILFIGILLYAKVPAKIGGLLDARAVQIKAELEAALAARDRPDG